MRLLKEELLKKAHDEPERYVAISKVVEAENELRHGDQLAAAGVLSTLGGTAQWVVEVAKDLSVKLVAELLSTSLGS